MYSFFCEFEGNEAPSFSKFARSIGITLCELEGYRMHKRFDEAYRECSEIRRDYLIDRALTKRYDASFVKFLLSDADGDDADNDIAVTVRVIE